MMNFSGRPCPPTLSPPVSLTILAQASASFWKEPASPASAPLSGSVPPTTIGGPDGAAAAAAAGEADGEGLAAGLVAGDGGAAGLGASVGLGAAAGAGAAG